MRRREKGERTGKEFRWRKFHAVAMRQGLLCPIRRRNGDRKRTRMELLAGRLYNFIYVLARDCAETMTEYQSHQNSALRPISRHCVRHTSRRYRHQEWGNVAEGSSWLSNNFRNFQYHYGRLDVVVVHCWVLNVLVVIVGVVVIVVVALYRMFVVVV